MWLYTDSPSLLPHPTPPHHSSPLLLHTTPPHHSSTLLLHTTTPHYSSTPLPCIVINCKHTQRIHFRRVLRWCLGLQQYVCHGGRESYILGLHSSGGSFAYVCPRSQVRVAILINDCQLEYTATRRIVELITQALSCT